MERKAAVQKRKENMYPRMLVAKSRKVVFRQSAAAVMTPAQEVLRRKWVVMR